MYVVYPLTDLVHLEAVPIVSANRDLEEQEYLRLDSRQKRVQTADTGSQLVPDCSHVTRIKLQTLPL